MLYWFFYLPLTAIVIIALVKVPENILDTSIQPFELDAGITEQRLAQKVTQYSPVFGTQANTLTKDFKKRAVLYLSEKRYGYRISAGGETYYGNKEFYEDAYPLAPFRYHRFTIHKRFNQNGKPVHVTIDQTFPLRYEKQR